MGQFFIELVGFGAAASMTVAFLPQAIKVWKTKSAKDISLTSFSIFGMGVALWLAYGLMIWNLPIIISNGLILPLVVWILWMRIKYG